MKNCKKFGFYPHAYTVNSYYREETTDEWMNELLGSDYTVSQLKCLDQRKTRKFGIGDLGLRMLPFLIFTLIKDCKKKKPDFILYPVPPWYILIAAPIVKWFTKVPYGIDGELVAARYAEFMDSGLSYEHTVSKLALDFHKDERHIMRIVAANKQIVATKKYMRSLSEHFPNNEVAKELNEITSQLVRLMDEAKNHQRKRIDPQSNLEVARKLIAQLNEQILAAASAVAPG